MALSGYHSILMRRLPFVTSNETQLISEGYTKPHKKRKCDKHKLPKSPPKNFSSPADLKCLQISGYDFFV